MIYKCPKENRNCLKCLFENICYDCGEVRNAVSEVELPRAVPVSYESEDER